MKREAFTLAEVLITLGIIGVVAALTLPTLIQNYQKHVTISRLKKMYTITSQLIQRAENETGIKVLDSPEWQQKDPEIILRKYFLPY